MTDNNEYNGLSFMQQLNLYRNRYYTDGNSTERGIIANAINDIFSEINRQKAEIESAKAKIKICVEVIERQDKEIDRLRKEDW